VSVVIDASLALSWLFEDEQTPLIMNLLQQVSGTGAFVPSLWRLEIGNALQIAIKRNRINPAYRDAMIQKLVRLPIVTDPNTNEYAWTTTLHLAEVHQLTLYDASYLELTLRLGLPLATRDTALAVAAKTAGANLLPTR
jgi:predicted nucleic acid-binding protein